MNTFNRFTSSLPLEVIGTKTDAEAMAMLKTLVGLPPRRLVAGHRISRTSTHWTLSYWLKPEAFAPQAPAPQPATAPQPAKQQRTRISRAKGQATAPAPAEAEPPPWVEA